MKYVRRAFFMATLGQYLSIVISLSFIVVMSRMMAPTEIGLSVIGLSVTTMVFSLREFVASDFLIQLDKVEPQDVCTARTVMVCFTCVLAIGLFLASPWLAQFYENVSLKLFLWLTITAAVIESLAAPNLSLLRRDMQFGTVTLIDTVRLSVNAIATIGFAMLDWGFVSFAIGALVASIASTALTLAARQLWWSFIPSFQSLPALTRFGRYRGATSVVDRLYDSLPMVMLGSIMSSAAVGRYNRSVTISNLPDKLVLSSVFSVAFPALAAGVRNNLDIKPSYLRALGFISAVYWPALLMVAIISDPIVRLVLGHGWEDVIPIARLLTLSSVFFFPVVLTYPLLIALNANRSAFAFNMISRVSSAAILCIAAFFGVTAIAASQFISLPLQMVLCFIFVRRYIRFEWWDLYKAILPSFLASLSAITGPLLVAAYLGFRFNFTAAETVLVCFLAIIGWFIGLKATRHPILNEINIVFTSIAERIRAWRPYLLKSAQR
ncbi:oligosaccharide flippase family protein [Phyllobacterium endophyticum]|uniref:oligosaccharide flippase family protein n=1 Tax=Phyllobacterium endophyticum TaxID=1149773 RepID=UPI0011CA4134|nr:oligosaccharide flippase family protein [Phyllobacterium endophyticum]TXR48337.1 oligosaccharide flippase family protein [Phyllobacterium endophyticum]